MKLNKKDLLRNQSYVDGKWIDSENKNTFTVYNPYDKRKIIDIANMGINETQIAIEAAKRAFKIWNLKTAEERGYILKKWYQLQLENIDDLSLILTKEQGKTLSEARGEIHYGASFAEWFAEEGRRTYGKVIPKYERDKRLIILKQPIGIVAAITPWNFPNAMVVRKVAPALAAGCTVILKPAEETPLSALALAVLGEEAGFPSGVFNIITTNQPKIVGEFLTKSPIVRKLSFTGSTPVGKLLMKQSADTVKKISLELGGNAPFIVLEDADINKAVSGAITSKYRNSGQTCICANRIYVHENIYGKFIEKFSKAVLDLKVGSGMEKEVSIGPMINEAAIQKIEYLIQDAKEKGANILVGGKRLGLKNNFYSPTILTQVNNSMAISKEEIFGPVAPIFSFKTQKEVVEMANDTEYGLAAYFYGKDITKIWHVAEALEYGIVGINTGILSTPVAPFGGVKESGIGREGSKYGIEEYMETKYLCFGNIS